MMKYVLMMLVMAGSVQAAPEKAASDKMAPKKNQDVNFEDLLVSGQYHFSDEAVTTVEEDKVLNSLIGVRADFKDRMKQSATLGEVKNP
ncbi:hypothetical protein AB1A81_10885 [Bdellovibrio bacteriovorus]|uniref:Uncharacterized protein n=2 Tax=Bdellovibrio bacteriovorus TaxID=959 RepID=Q6MKL5_BDEBA|nr:hypothetical protein [Bdellovibrio bacteriovorus]AFY02011.1 hypothetical protein Bdt_2328 [Bdellovibrio bacteriovorus str. Tiberius]CAE80192.1 hypothetical protein predicted by Glimmer/Critica [Bdellovibrio bacteriovorus HD100]